MRSSAQLSAITGAFILCAAFYARAEVSGQVDATLNVEPGCLIDNGNVPDGGSGYDFGTLDFGTVSTIWTNPLQATLSSPNGGGQLSVTCSPGVDTFTLTINGGTNGDGTSRNLSSEGNTVPYQVFRDSGESIPYEINQPESFDVASAGDAIEVPVYGLVAPNPETPVAAGTYIDTLTLTFNF
ncbi:Spore coat protein U (SCPU) domain-containing protein [Kushneria avicenniae]|uniref:Spore coat protein U (SCPU) domain-containing protein n=1 Tax=Kushneria avicenniae TaxID=402385 RepID=A0A1I1LNB4_9GAMM|nr:spore coat U domain-containing protein [Kushneria avicenniae]SFC72458.1 Spore coat protein U (SCPU) domain-containing protein [Kushneria avicenniae]